MLKPIIISYKPNTCQLLILYKNPENTTYNNYSNGSVVECLLFGSPLYFEHIPMFFNLWKNSKLMGIEICLVINIFLLKYKCQTMTK